MKKISKLLLLALIISSCAVNKNSSENKKRISPEDYYITFTEATKHMLLGNVSGDYSRYKTAIGLYGLCIEHYPEKAAPYYQISSIYLSVNEVDLAKEYAKKTVALDDTNKWYLLQLASIYQYEKNVDSLIYVYEKLVKITDRPEYKYNLALYYNANGSYEKSMSLANELTESIEGTRELRIIRHRNYAAMDMPDSALVELELLLDAFPDSFESYGMLAEYLSEISRYKEAQLVYKELLLKEPDNGLANLSYGDYYLKRADLDSALIYYERGFNSNDISLEDKMGIVYNYMYDGTSIANDSVFIPSLINVLKEKYTDPRPYALAAEYYIKKQDYETASIALKDAVDNGAENYVIWEQFLMINNFLGNHTVVKDYYLKALDLFSNEINLYIFSGYSLFSLEEYEAILEHEEVAVAITELEKDQKIQYLNLLADTYRELNQISKSDSIFEEILVLDPENLLIRNNYAYYLAVRNVELERAKELSGLTVKRDPKNATFLDTYGWVLYKQGDYKEALKYIELAIKNGAYTNGEVLDHYGDVMYALERCTEAREAWSEAIKYDDSLSEQIEEKIKKLEISNCAD